MEIILVALPEELDYRAVSVPVIYTGVGISNAAVIACEAVLKYRPSLVINYGSAGALSDVSGLLTVSHVCQRDADCSPLRERGYMLGENILYYTSMHDTDSETGLRCGSGNNFVTDPDAWTRQHCDIVDMELWSIAKVCERFNTPWISKKWISDRANGEAAASWEENVARGQQEFINWYNSGK